MHPIETVTRKYKLLLGSKSPRRRRLMQEAGIPCEILPTIETEERYPDGMPHEKVPEFLAVEKAKAYAQYISGNNLLITADTIVSLDHQILGKPVDLDNARILLQKLSGNCHKVYSGVCLTSTEKQSTFTALTKVYFKKLSSQEIEHYLSHFAPLDKAGAYGIQEWIGYIGVEKIEGSFYNVMGLPIQKLYNELMVF
jgi:septum formation protein